VKDIGVAVDAGMRRSSSSGKHGGLVRVGDFEVWLWRRKMCCPSSGVLLDAMDGDLTGAMT